MSKHQIVELFPMKVLQSEISDKTHIKVKNLANSLNYNYIDKFSNIGKTHKVNDCEGINHFDQDVISKYNLTELQDEINSLISIFIKEGNFTTSNFKSISRTSWITKFDYNDYGNIHTHGGNDISGVYYIQTNQKDGNFIIESPNSAVYGMTNLQSDSIYTIKPKEKKLILFNSWLPHGVGRNLYKEPRMSLSFNIKFI